MAKQESQGLPSCFHSVYASQSVDAEGRLAHVSSFSSLQSSLTNDMIWDLHPLYQSLQDNFGSRMQAIWGDEDPVCPSKDGASKLRKRKVLLSFLC